MNHIYLGLTLSLICLFLAYLFLSKYILVTVFCLILAVLYFKDDFIIFRYLTAHVVWFYSWICDLFFAIQNMYHQSNNTNFPIRKTTENNGVVTRKFERLHHGSSYNLSTSYVIDNQSVGSGIWDTSSKLSPSNSSIRTQSTLQDMSKLNINHVRRETSDRHSKSYNYSSISPLQTNYKPRLTGYSGSPDLTRSQPSSSSALLHHSSNNENKPLNPRLYADVSSPGFCGRVAERLHEEDLTHQSKYDTVGAFPVVNLKSQSPKIKLKTPVRVRLAPPTNEPMHYNYEVNNMTRSPVLGPDESMKSVLQVLKEISRKRMHSHIDEEAEESSKRLRVTDTHFDSDGLLHTSLLQQTIQGKRAREESSPNEDDKKRRKASLRNNEILSSLSSSISIRPPHLQTAKRKAQSIDDSVTSTPVLGKLLKVQREVTPPAPTNRITAPEVASTVVEESRTKASPASPSISIPSPIIPPPAVVPTPVKSSAKEVKPVPAEETKPEEAGAVSRLLGRMSDQTSGSGPMHIPVKKNVFMSTNDLSLSPPKENRLAAMIAVLGGPSEQSELENIQQEAPKQPERLIKGKSLFTTPETPATPEATKQKKNVTFSESLTTKIFDREEPDSVNPRTSNTTLAPLSTPLTSVVFSSSANTTTTEPKLNFVSENTSTVKPFALNFGSSPLSSTKEAVRPSVNVTNTPTSSAAASTSTPGSQPSMFQVQSSNFTAASTPAGVSTPTFSVPSQVSSSNLGNAQALGGFSFGANSPLTNKESSAKQNSSSPSVKDFSFGSESTSQSATTLSGFPPIFSSAFKSDTATETGTAGHNKPAFNMFGNKDSSSTSNKGVETKPMVNGFAPPSSTSSPFALSQPNSQANSTKPNMSFAVNANPTTTPAFNFGTSFSSNSAASQQQATLPTFTSTTQQASAVTPQPSSLTSVSASPSTNMFNSSVSSPVQSKPAVSSMLPTFGSGINPFASGATSGFKAVSSSGQNSQVPSVFGSTPSLQNGAGTTSIASQNNNIFGNVSSNSTRSFSSEPNPTTQQSTMFKFSGTPASTQANSPFGITLNNSTTNTSTMFGNPTTAQSTSVFGSGTPSTASQSSTFPTPSATAGQPSLFGSIANNNDTSKTMFTGTSNANPTFGGLGSTSSPAFGNQSNPTPTFGGQSTTVASTFGSQSSPAFAFGSQNTNSNPNAVGFGGAGVFGGSSSNSSTNEAKPPAFGSASPFMFGSTTSSKPTEAVKPLGAATPFAFGSGVQQSSAVNPSQPSVPSFGAPTPTFGATQPAPTFGGGTSQVAAPTFQFGQGSSSAAPAFQFNAAPPTVGGGMFSIGSGGSSTSRPKTTATRRSHKRT